MANRIENKTWNEADLRQNVTESAGCIIINKQNSRKHVYNMFVHVF